MINLVSGQHEDLSSKSTTAKKIVFLIPLLLFSVCNILPIYQHRQDRKRGKYILAEVLERSDLTPSVLPTGFTQRENKVL
jgi:hypothetical protein